MHRILAVGEIHRLGYVKPQHSNEGLKMSEFTFFHILPMPEMGRYKTLNKY
jgi:hypothetical protein